MELERHGRHFQEELEQLKTRLLEMGGLAEEQVRLAVKALMECSDDLRYPGFQIWQYQLANYTPYVVAGLLFMLLTIPMTRFTDAVSRRYGYTPGGGHL